jgi:hypothetical protein
MVTAAFAVYNKKTDEFTDAPMDPGLGELKEGNRVVAGNKGST